MPAPAHSYRVVFGGSLAGGEVWESGFWVNGAEPTSNSEANATAQLWWGQLTSTDASGALHLVSVDLWDPTVTLTYCKVYSYPAGGTTAAYIGVYSSSLVGTQATKNLPNQVAMVVSLRTDSAGRSYRGRMYIPVGGVTSLGAGQFASGTITPVATAWALCFTDWNASGDNGIVCVVSTKRGVATNVTDVLIDSRPDIQRRRADKQAVTTTASAAVTGG